MRQLQSSLFNWDGLELMESRLLRKGYQAHLVEWEAMASFCESQNCEISSERYWRERTLEIVRSAGLAKPDKRWFIDPVVYRSSYLDNMALHNRNASNPVRSYSLDACYSNWIRHKQKWSDTEALALRSDIERRKEIEKPSVDMSAWDGTRYGMFKVLSPGLCARGFRPVSTLSWDEDVLRDALELNENDIIFQVGVQKGRTPSLDGSIDLMFRLSHTGDQSDFFHIGTFSGLIPFFSSYRLFGTSKSALVGISAFSELIIAFVDSTKQQRD